MACGGGDAGSGGAGSGFRAVIDGASWQAEPLSIAATTAAGVPGGIVLVGSQTSGSLVRTLTISLNDLTGPGTYALGVGPGVYGGTASVGEAPLGSGAGHAWATPLNGRAGQITLTSVGPRIIGTFAYVAEAGKGDTAGGTRTVTEGVLDLPLTGTLSPVPEGMGSKVTATLNGQPYNAWYVNGRFQDYTGAAGINVDTASSANALSLMLSGVGAPGSYALSDMAPLRTIIVGKTGGDATSCCWGLNGGSDEGTIVVTSLTAHRVQGTFSGTLSPQPQKPATTPLVITDGTFDVGVP